MTPENLVNFFSDPSILFICGLVVLTGTLMLRIYRKKRTFDTCTDKTGEQEFKIFPQPEVSSQVVEYKLPSTLQADQIRKIMDQWEVEMLNTTRCHKAEIDTKIVALQLLVAEAGRQVQKLEQLIQQAQGSSPCHDTAQKTIVAGVPEESFPEQDFPNPAEDLSTESWSTENALPEDMKIEDPFVDVDFERTREELDRFAGRLADLDLGLPDPFQTTEEPSETIENPSETVTSSTPPEDTSPVVPSEKTKTGEQLGRGTILRGLFPEFDVINRKPAQKRPNITFSSSKAVRSSRPPQIDSLVKSRNDMTSPKTVSAVTPTAEIPRASSPQAENIFDASGLAGTESFTHMSIKHDKHHEIRFLAEKGLTSRDIASFLDMTIGEVEMTLSSGPVTYRYPGKTSSQ